MARQLPPGRTQPAPAPATGGPINAVVCPCCGKPNDYRTLQEEQLLDTGHECSCDHCQYIMEVVAIRTVTLVSVRPSQKRPGRAPPQQLAQPARTISAAAAQKLLGRRR